VSSSSSNTAKVGHAGQLPVALSQVRRMAGKARRSPRWAARQVRTRYRAMGASSVDPFATDAATPPGRFDAHWYLLSNPDVRTADVDPWVHYQHHGRFEGRSPHAHFDRAWYSSQYPDSTTDGRDPWADWAGQYGPNTRNPNEFFDVDWYLSRHPEVAEASLDPVEHYRLHGWREGRRPSPLFDPAWYLGHNPDVAAIDIDPLTHYLQHGRGEGRPANVLEHTSAAGQYRPPTGLIPWFSPVEFFVRPDLAEHPRLNVLVPGLGIRHMTGGPNTAIQLAYRLAARGLHVRFIATDAPLDDDTSALWSHMANISDVGTRLDNVEVVDGSDRFAGVAIGANDLFMATAWWTAQSIKAALPLVRQQRFVYLIQDFEPLFFASSSQYALALETYALDHVPVINSQFLLDHLSAERVGRFADPDFVERALVFEPSVDSNLFSPRVPTSVKQKRRLLFYTRPQNGLRNLFELGTAALQMAIRHEVFDEDEWEFLGMGDPFDALAVGPRSVLRPAPWHDLAGYAAQMRESDILLSPMLAPHPSYPPLEMAACGGPAVTTVFGPKTAEALASISSNIIGTEATIEGLACGLAEAVGRLADVQGRLDATDLALPATWAEAFEDVVPELQARLDECWNTVPSLSSAGVTGPAYRYATWLDHRIEQRRHEYPAPEFHDDVLFSLATAVWNTPAEFLQALADSVFHQDLSEGWEWVIVDNGSTNPETLAVLDQLRETPNVVVERSETNLGILGGLRRCLELATGRYLLHLDHDDLLTPDALRIAASHVVSNGFPEAFYSDEDKVLGRRQLEPYLKPDWDPVLFSNSCYVAHLCGVDRQRALELDAYLDPATEASPDWDLFTRFVNAGVTPRHIPEILYSWRIHSSSTASNPGAKPYALATHRRVLERFVEAHSDFEHFDIEIHPDSPEQNDWWLRRRQIDARPLVSIVVGHDVRAELSTVPLVDHAIHHIDVDQIDEFARIVERAADAGALVHVFNSSTRLLRPQWYWDALGLFELFDDTSVVGGPVITAGRIHSAGNVFGFGPSGWGSPAHGEPDDSRGWFAQNLKQHSVDGIAGDHAVFEARRLHEFLQHERPDSMSTVGARFSHFAAEHGWRVVYSPLLRAEVTQPFEEMWTSGEDVSIGRRGVANASGRNRSTFLSLDASKPHAPTTERDRSAHLGHLLILEAAPSITYHQWLTDELTDRQNRYPLGDEPPLISIITPVYMGTDASLFSELAASLAGQSHPFHEWVIGLDGEISEELRIELDRIGETLGSRVRVVGGVKAGILTTMRSCLDACTAEYLVPVDADDLLTHDALAILASAADAADRPDLVHSDEDVLDGTQHRDPFVRPDWDPVLHLSSSYVWHALCIKHSAALAVDIYDDPAFEWCHDWDTVERIRRAGGTFVHVPEVLYHWRRHIGSSTNTDTPEADQQNSVRAMFDRMAADTGHPDRYETEEFPLWRGATELHLRRLHHDAPSVALVSLGPMTKPMRGTVTRDAEFPFCSVHEGPTLDGDVAGLVRILEDVDADLVWLVDGTTLVGGCDPIWEAVKWFELLPDVIAVCGRSIDESGTVCGGADVVDPGNPASTMSPIAGRRLDDPGPYALALKPHSIDAIDWGSVIARRDALIGLLKPSCAGGVPNESAATETPTSLAVGRIVFDPLLTRTCAHDPRRAPLPHSVVAARSGLGPLTNARRKFL